ncbi:MAG TPA: tetratricopeptide repeat protein, partial [Longimicrobiales bacterium]
DAAIARDPGFALAHAGVADAFNALGSWEAAALAPLDAFPRAHAAAVRALELNPQLAEAHTPLAYASMHYLWAWRQAEAQFQRAIALDPRYVHAHHWYSHYLMATRRVEESLAESRRALELEPVDIIINVHLAWHYWLAGLHEEAVEQCARTAELDPRDQWAPFFSGLALASHGDVSRAVEEHRKALELSGGNTVMLAGLGHTYAAAGDSAAARAIADRLAREHAPRHVCAYELAVIHAALGERDQAFDWLDRAYVERSAWLPYLAVDPRNEPLRGDARFRTLLHAVGLAETPAIAVAPPA